MHKQVELNGILANLDILGKQQQWLAQQPALKTNTILLNGCHR
jgi:hypothetical protein